MSDPRTLAFYNEKAKEYATWSAEAVAHPSLTRFLDSFSTPARLLDFGCGGGWAAHGMLKAGHNVTAMDVSEGLIEQARGALGDRARLGSSVDVAKAGPFAGIWAHFCLQHVERVDRPGTFADLAAGLEEGGVFYMGAQSDAPDWRDDFGRMYITYSEAELVALCESAGFEIEEIESGTGKNYDGTPTTNLLLWARRRG